MAISIDSSTVARFGAAGGSSATSGSFTAAAGSLLLACISHDASVLGVRANIDDTGSLLWNRAVEKYGFDDGGGWNGACIAWAIAPTSVGRTVTVSTSPGDSHNTKIFIISGYDQNGPIGATAKGANSSTNFNVSYAATRIGSIGFGASEDWSNGTGATSSDSNSPGATGAVNDSLAVWKATASTSVGQTISLNFQESGTPNVAYAVCEVLPAAATSSLPGGWRELMNGQRAHRLDGKFSKAMQ